jgi:DNA repair exonuclease SbcCD ATPase subunit
MQNDVHTLCLEKFRKVRKAKRYFDMLEELSNEKIDISLQRNKLDSIISSKEKLDKSVEKAYITMKEAKAEMPESCPLCGGPLDKERM